jgi:hypothetical protein
VHHQVGVRDLRVNSHDAVHRQNVTGGLAGELVGLPVRFARKPATSTKSYTGRVVLVGIASGFRSVG